MAAKPGLPTGHAAAPGADGRNLFPPGSVETSILTRV